nr:serine protease ami-like [Procambarus clarkii]
MLAAPDCAHHYQDITPASLCALPANATSRNLCEADLGGPLVVEGRSEKGVKGQYVQVGVAVYTDGCEEHVDDGRLPGVYTDLTPYLRWINETVGPDDTCH